MTCQIIPNEGGTTRGGIGFDCAGSDGIPNQCTWLLLMMIVFGYSAENH